MPRLIGCEIVAGPVPEERTPWREMLIARGSHGRLWLAHRQIPTGNVFGSLRLAGADEMLGLADMLSAVISADDDLAVGPAPLRCGTSVIASVRQQTDGQLVIQLSGQTKRGVGVGWLYGSPQAAAGLRRLLRDGAAALS